MQASLGAQLWVSLPEGRTGSVWLPESAGKGGIDHLPKPFVCSVEIGVGGS